jgi:beta-N-acetylhexosaminidase
MDGLLDAGVIPTAKQFPGHGGVTTDSHKETPFLTKTLAEMEATDLVPFRMAIDAGVPMIMMSHVASSAWSNIPASIDPLAYSYLREELGFTGVTITDSLGMPALFPYGGTGDNTVAALNAGADLILMPSPTHEAYYAILQALYDGTLTREWLEESAARVIALMRYQASIDPAVDVEGDYVRALSQEAMTVVAPLCGTRLVGSTVSISGADRSDRDLLAASLAEYGVTVGSSGTSIRLIKTSDGTGTADIVVALDGPWGLSYSEATVYIGLYGRGPSSLAALADVLIGAVSPNSRWPVEVPGMPYDPCPSPR